MPQRLGDLTHAMKTQANRYTAGRFLQALVMGKGSPMSALAWAEGQGNWLDRSQVVGGLKAAVQGYTSADFPGALSPIADSFLAAMRSDSIPLRLAGLRRVPMFTRIFVNSQGAVAAQVAEGAAIPVLRGDWSAVTLTPKKHAGIVVQTDELAKSTSPTAPLALIDDLVKAVAEAENLGFCGFDTVGSVLYGAPSFTGTGAAVANVDADLLRLVGLVPGAFRDGAAFLMDTDSSTFLSLLRGSGGATAYPDIGPQGGTLLGLPVLITSAMQQVGSPATHAIGLLSPSEIFWADEGVVQLTTSIQAALEMDDAPTGNAATGTAASGVVSMWQSNAVAARAIRESSWYARAGSGAFFITGF